jgi:hypothetical protein
LTLDSPESPSVYSVGNDDGRGDLGVRFKVGPVLVTAGDEKIAVAGGGQLDPANGRTIPAVWPLLRIEEAVLDVVRAENPKASLGRDDAEDGVDEWKVRDNGVTPGDLLTQKRGE